MSAKQTHKDALRIVAIGVALFVAFGLVAGIGGWRAELAESNYQANKIRLQNFLFGPQPRAVLVGSSISGRLLPSYFQDTLLGPLANLGLDGSGPLYGLDLVQSRPPAIVLIEANTLLRQHNENDEALELALRNPEFHAARYIPMLQTERRPSSILYSLLKREEGKHVSRMVNRSTKPEPTVPEPAESKEPTSQRFDDNGNKKELYKQIRAVLNKGSKVFLVRIPTGLLLAPGTDPNFALANELSQELGIPQLDLGAECANHGESMSFSDGLHLTPDAARSVGRRMAELVASLTY